MIMTPRLSKLVLTSHITFSVGWLGAVAVFLALAITGINSQDIQLSRAAYLAMEISGWFVIVPFCIISLLTGIAQSLGTKWGLFKHYWIIVKFFLTVAITILLLLHMQPISNLAELAANPAFSNNEQPGLRIQMIADAGAALLVLLAITTISVYKPWGRTRYGLVASSKQYTAILHSGKATWKSWKFYILVGSIILVLLFLIKHLMGGSIGGH
jgi:hypothetical protein